MSGYIYEIGASHFPVSVALWLDFRNVMIVWYFAFILFVIIKTNLLGVVVVVVVGVVIGAAVGIVVVVVVVTVNIKTISKYCKTGATSGTGTAYPSGLLFGGIRFAQSLVFYVVFSRSVFFLSLLTIALSVLWFTASECPLGIFHLFLKYRIHKGIQQHCGLCWKYPFQQTSKMPFSNIADAIITLDLFNQMFLFFSSLSSHIGY